jgi:hypothetical protein
MNLIKSKINSLAWLSTAISVSVVGGVVLSSTPVLAAYLVPIKDQDTLVEFKVFSQIPFITGGLSTIPYRGSHWQGTVQITQSNESARDDLLVRVYLQHIRDQGGVLNLDFRSTSLTAEPQEFARDTSRHPGTGHFDTGVGILNVTKNRSSDTRNIERWELEVRGEHTSVPEPATILGTTLALGWGGWLKRKNSMKQDKTKSQG